MKVTITIETDDAVMLENLIRIIKSGENIHIDYDPDFPSYTVDPIWYRRRWGLEEAYIVNAITRSGLSPQDIKQGVLSGALEIRNVGPMRMKILRETVQRVIAKQTKSPNQS